MTEEIPDEHASLIGVSLDELGRAEVETIHRDGSTERVALEESEKWDTEGPQPESWQHRGGALIEKKRGALTRLERIEQSIRVEAALVKALSPSTRSSLTKDTIPTVLAEVLDAMAHGWQERSAECREAT